ncbi:MAG: hypothetical protein WAN33_01145 [Candidatus Acidiferrales bacterium]
MQPQEEASAELLDDAVADPPLPVRAAKVENWIVERWLPHSGHSGLPFFAVTMRSKRDLHSSQTYS